MINIVELKPNTTCSRNSIRGVILQRFAIAAKVQSAFRNPVVKAQYVRTYVKCIANELGKREGPVLLVWPRGAIAVKGRQTVYVFVCDSHLPRCTSVCLARLLCCWVGGWMGGLIALSLSRAHTQGPIYGRRARSARQIEASDSCSRVDLLHFSTLYSSPANFDALCAARVMTRWRPINLAFSDMCACSVRVCVCVLCTLRKRETDGDAANMWLLPHIFHIRVRPLCDAPLPQNTR